MAALPPYIQFDGRADQTLRHIHRHAAIVVPDMDAIKSRLREHGVEVLFDPKEADPEDDMAANMAAGWMKMYGDTPIFCLDPFGNLIEFVPGQYLK